MVIQLNDLLFSICHGSSPPTMVFSMKLRSNHPCSEVANTVAACGMVGNGSNTANNGIQGVEGAFNCLAAMPISGITAQLGNQIHGCCNTSQQLQYLIISQAGKFWRGNGHCSIPSSFSGIEHVHALVVPKFRGRANEPTLDDFAANALCIPAGLEFSIGGGVRLCDMPELDNMGVSERRQVIGVHFKSD
jgi:hypothetical protein